MGDIHCRCGELWSFRGLHYTTSDLPWYHARELIRGAGCPACQGEFDGSRDDRWRRDVERESEGEILFHRPWGEEGYQGYGRTVGNVEAVLDLMEFLSPSSTETDWYQFLTNQEFLEDEKRPGEVWLIIHDHLSQGRTFDRMSEIRADATQKAWESELAEALGGDYEILDNHPDLPDGKLALKIGGYDCPASSDRKLARTWQSWYDLADLGINHHPGEDRPFTGLDLLERLVDPLGEPDPEAYGGCLEELTGAAQEEARDKAHRDANHYIYGALDTELEIPGDQLCNVCDTDENSFLEFSEAKCDDWLALSYRPLGWSFHQSVLNPKFYLAAPAGLNDHTSLTIKGLILWATDPLIEWGEYRTDEFILENHRSHALPSISWLGLPPHTRAQFLSYLRNT